RHPVLCAAARRGGSGDRSTGPRRARRGRRRGWREMLATTPAPTIDVRRTTPGDAPALTAFLARMFDPEAVVGERHMHWKYWSPRSDWAGSRSFVACRNGAIVAHAAVWPVRIRVGDQTVSAVHAVDWAADPGYPGAGIRV